MAKVVMDGKTLDWGAPDTLLECLEKNGVEVPSSCRSGVCQSCLLKAVHGTPPHNSQDDLKETWKQQGLFLSCVARDATDLEVALPQGAAGKVEGTIIHKQLRGDDVVVIRVKTDGPFEYRAGQFANLIRADGLTRSYSIASIPQDGVVEFQVRKVSNGRMSCWLYDDATEGARVTLRGPSGDCFYVDGKPDQPLVLVGTGTGLAPLWGVARDALLQGHRGPIHLFHGGKSLSHLYLHEELRALSQAHPNFHYWPAVTEPSDDTTLHRGRVNAVMEKNLPDLKGHRVFLCGSPPMVKDLKQHVYKAGVEVDDILADSFVSAPPPPPKPAEKKNLLALAPEAPGPKKETRPFLQKVRFSVQAATFAGFILQALLYYGVNFRPLGGLLPFMAYDSLGHMMVSSALLAWAAIFVLVMVFGRFVCGWLCPFGFIQDAGQRLLEFFNVKLRRPLNQPRLVRLILAILVLGHFVVLPLMSMPVRLWQVDLHYKEPWLLGFPFRLGLFALDLTLIFVVIGVVLPLFFGPRPYCKLVCETGFLLDRASQLAFGRIRRNHGFDQDTCLSCQRCTNICPQGINVFEEVHLFDRVVNSNCITCLQCVNTCPNNTIIYSLRKRVADTGKVAGYLASMDWRASDLPRHVATGAGVVAGAYTGFVLLPPSYFHTYLLFASLGGLTGYLLYRAAGVVTGRGLETALKEGAQSVVERQNKERILPLSKQERLAVAPVVQGSRALWPMMAASYLLVAGLAVYAVTSIPPRIVPVSELPADKRLPAARHGQKILYFGVPPSVAEADLHRTYAGLHTYLTRALHMDVRLVTGATYGEVGHAVEKAHIDAALLPAGAAYALLKRDRGVNVLAMARAVVKGETTYSGSIVTLDGGPGAVKELVGKRVALTSLDSLSGYLAPVAVMRWQGVRVTDLAEVVMAGNHSRGLALLLSGRVDAAAAFDGAVARFHEQHPTVKFKELGSVGDLPTDVVLVSSSLPETRRFALVDALRKVGADANAEEVRGDLAHGGITGFVDARSEDFVGMERFMDEHWGVP